MSAHTISPTLLYCVRAYTYFNCECHKCYKLLHMVACPKENELITYTQYRGWEMDLGSHKTSSSVVFHLLIATARALCTDVFKHYCCMVLRTLPSAQGSLARAYFVRSDNSLMFHISSRRAFFWPRITHTSLVLTLLPSMLLSQKMSEEIHYVDRGQWESLRRLVTECTQRKVLLRCAN